VKELGDWVGSSARESSQGGIRTLCVDTHRVSYEYGLIEARSDLAVVYMIDATMHATEPAAYPLFHLGACG
jgi:hypothetical protein